MRILFVHSSSGRYGADRQLALIATGLDRASYEPLVVLPEHGELATELQAAGIEVLTRPLAVIRRGLMNPRGIAALALAASRDAVGLRALIRRRRIALVHSNTSVVLAGAAAAAAAGVSHVWHVREIYSRFERLWPGYRRLLASATALPCVSRATAAQFGTRGSPVVIPDGLATDARRAPRAQARAALGLEAQTPVLAVVGRISDWKGQEVLVRALAQPPLRDRGAVGLIAGEPWPGSERYRTRLVALAQASGVGQRLRMLGFRPDLETVWGACDLVAVPSTAADPLPGSAIEAAAAGCTVIASALGGLPEIIHDRRTGRLLAPGDAGALAELAAELLDDPAERERLGAAAARDVRERFAPAALLRSIEGLYARIRGERQAAHRR